jgi:hypothetical protein
VLPDEQSNLERTNFAFLAGLAGTNVFSGAGMLEQGKTFSHLQLVMDDEIHAMIKLVLGGISVEGAPGCGGTERGDREEFLIDDLTLKYFRPSASSPACCCAKQDPPGNRKAASLTGNGKEKVFDILKISAQPC